MSDLEIIPKEAFEKGRGGSYHISREHLITLNPFDIQRADDLINHLVESNPHYIFKVMDNKLTGGITIGWWPIESGTEESGDPKVLPWS